MSKMSRHVLKEQTKKEEKGLDSDYPFDYDEDSKEWNKDQDKQDLEFKEDKFRPYEPMEIPTPYDDPYKD